VDRQEILKLLQSEAAQAAEAHKVAHATFMESLSDAPSGLHHQDKEQRRSNARSAWNQASDRLIVAKTKLEQFQTNGVLPDDLT
jgi:hypothetical protein